MYRQFNQHGYGNDATYQQADLGGSYVYQQFSSPMGSQINQEMQQSQHLSPPIKSVRTSSPSHSRHDSNDSNRLRRAASRSLSPRLGMGPPSSNIPPFIPDDRSLPSQHVTAETITDAYVDFILYCNPNFALDVDATTLRSNFSSPPKSDNKDFETFRLFELIRKFYAKEIKTWGQLALDLGVEAPDVSKGQSVQKVQQYSVRLKRWMRAMHVDAFFEYLLGKPHPYYQDVPHKNNPYAASGRDGVAAEEDLAIRALDPSFRPKRGRRRNSEAEQDDEAHPETAQQAAPQSAYPTSAYPGTGISFGASSSTDPWVNTSAISAQDFEPWVSKLDGPHSAIAATAPSNIRWQNPGTPHPMTALPGSMTAHIDAALQNEPKSAITPSSRKRRKHGPAVSSAWPSANAPGAKPRGRPPANRNVQDGPFNTFPADPANDKSKAAVNTMNSVEQGDDAQSRSALPQQPQQQVEAGGRPGRLSLQVPRHTGGPVRLATPPRVMVTNETSESEHSMMDNVSTITDARSQDAQADVMADSTAPRFGYETLKRVLASDLLRAELFGRQHRLNTEEAKRLAEAILQRLNVPRDDRVSTQDGVTRLTAASWLGVGGHVNVPFGSSTGHGKRIAVTRFRVGPDGYEELVSANDMESTASREIFDLSWSASMGSCNGSFELKGLSLADAPPRPHDMHDAMIQSWGDAARKLGMDEERIRSGREKYLEHFSTRTRAEKSDDGIDWKARYQALEFGGKMAKGEFHRYREILLQRVLDTII